MISHPFFFSKKYHNLLLRKEHKCIRKAFRKAEFHDILRNDGIAYYFVTNEI